MAQVPPQPNEEPPSPTPPSSPQPSTWFSASLVPSLPWESSYVKGYFRLFVLLASLL